MTPLLLSASSINGTDVKNTTGKKLGDIKDFMVNVHTGKIAYAILSFGGFLGFGDKYFAIPWKSLTVNPGDEDCFILNVTEEVLSNAPGFDKDNWPTRAEDAYLTKVYAHYGVTADW